jgi:hypothetical protein
VNGSQFDGVALLTFGLVASCFSPFVPPGGTAVITSWTVSYGASSTTWTPVSGTLYGPC